MEHSNRAMPEYTEVSSGKRFANFIIDRIISTVLVLMVGGISGLVLFSTDNSHLLDHWAVDLIDFLIGYLVYVVYYILMENTTGTSVGKLITGTVVVSEDGSKPTLKQIVQRSFSRIIPFEPFSFLGSGSSGWHDSLSSTMVILKHEQSKVESKDHLLDDWE